MRRGFVRLESREERACGGSASLLLDLGIFTMIISVLREFGILLPYLEVGWMFGTGRMMRGDGVKKSLWPSGCLLWCFSRGPCLLEGLPAG